MDQHQYGQANSRFLIPFSFWLDIPIDLSYIHPCKQTNVETDLYPLYIVIYQVCLLSHDAMISHNIEAISLIPFALLSFA